MNAEGNAGHLRGTARADQMVAAMAAGDHRRAIELLDSHIGAQELQLALIALGWQLVQTSREFYDTDCQVILDQRALESMRRAAEAE